jgi:hypothetical protein
MSHDAQLTLVFFKTTGYNLPNTPLGSAAAMAAVCRCANNATEEKWDTCQPVHSHQTKTLPSPNTAGNATYFYQDVPDSNLGQKTACLPHYPGKFFNRTWNTHGRFILNHDYDDDDIEECQLRDPAALTPGKEPPVPPVKPITIGTIVL